MNIPKDRGATDGESVQAGLAGALHRFSLLLTEHRQIVIELEAVGPQSDPAVRKLKARDRRLAEELARTSMAILKSWRPPGGRGPV